MKSKDYKKLLKDHAKIKLKVVNKKTPQIINEGSSESILKRAKIRRLQEHIININKKISTCTDKKEKLTLDMMLRKNKAKLYTISK